MDTIVIDFLRALAGRPENDCVDRLNYQGTVALLLFCAVSLGAKQYVGNPVQCFVPAQYKVLPCAPETITLYTVRFYFQATWEKYTERYCLIENTYYIPFTGERMDIPEEISQRKKRELNYYQWCPLILLFQAALFHAPHVVWRMLSFTAGFNVNAIANMAIAVDLSNDKGSERTDVYTIAGHVADAAQLLQRYKEGRKPGQFGFCRDKSDAYVTCVYMLTKLMYIGNAIGQFYLLNKFLGASHEFWGFHTIAQLVDGSDWTDTGHFPRVTMCDFEVRDVGNTRSESVQCVLMVNMFHEKVFLLIWCWLPLVALLTVCNFLWWLAMLLPCYRRRLVQMYLSLANTPQPERRQFYNFVRWIRTDGVLALRMISGSAGDVVVTRIVRVLWQEFDEPKILSALAFPSLKNGVAHVHPIEMFEPSDS